MHLRPLRALGALLAVCASAAVLPAGAAAATSAERSAGAWDRLSRAELAGRTAGRRTAVAPEAFAAFALDRRALAAVLEDAPGERAGARPLTVSIPTPDGGFDRFAIATSPVMSPGLAAQHPEIRTFAGRGVDDPQATIRLDLMPSGFHAAVRRPGGGYFVDPRAFGDPADHVAYDRGAIAEPDKDPFSVEDGDAQYGEAAARVADARAAGESVTLRTYRLALVSDPTYGTGTPGTTTEAKVALINRVNQVYEADLAVRLLLIAGNDALNLDTDALATGADGPCGSSPCYTSTANCDAVLERTAWVTGIIAGARNFDLGHVVLGNDGGGVAYFGVGEKLKGSGCTGRPNPVGDAFAIDYVAHEIGHQFYGSHTFNSKECEDNREPSTSVEPGSGSSIQAYAGICGADDLQAHSDPYFSQRSQAEIVTQVTKAPFAESAVQEVLLQGFGSGDEFRLRYAGRETQRITSFDLLTAAGLEAKIDPVLAPDGGSATVSGPGTSPTMFGGSPVPTTAGFSITVGGALAGAPAATFEVIEPTGFAGGRVADIVVGGPASNRGHTQVAMPNHHPDVAAPDDRVIPVRTPFGLTATGSDVDGDPLTFLWEQNDPGGADATALANQTKTDGPLFRQFATAARYSPEEAEQSPSDGQNAAGPDPSRSFPDLLQVQAGNTNAAAGTCPAGTAEARVDCLSEFLPTAVYGPAALNFRVTARDNGPGAGGTDFDDVVLTLAKGAGPFRVTSQALPQSIPEGSNLAVTWDVNGTASTPVNATQVQISLAKDGGPFVALGGPVPNSGTASVELPAGTASDGRIKVQGHGNVFYDLSRAPLTITASSAPILAGPASVAFGTVATDRTADRGVEVRNTGSVPASIGTATLGGADAGSFAKAADPCSNTTLPPGASCTVTVRLAPARAGALAAQLAVPSNAASSPLTVALEGTGATPPGPGGGGTTSTSTTPTPTPTPTDTASGPEPTPGAGTTTTTTPPPAAPPAGPPAPPSTSDPIRDPIRDAAARALRTANPVSLGSLGSLSLFAATRATSLGRPAASRRLLVAICRRAPCVLKPSATLIRRAANGRTARRKVTFPGLRLTRTRAVGAVTLKLARAQRAMIGRSRSASLRLTLRSGSRTTSRTFRFRVG